MADEQDLAVFKHAHGSLESLSPNTRAATLVGLFLQSWSIMEARLNDVIGRILHLEALQEAIVTSNLQFRSKIHIAKTGLSISYFMPEEKRDEYKKTLDQLVSYSVERNMVAHDMFWPDDDENLVGFNVRKAKGKLDFPSIKWSVGDFVDKIKNLDRSAASLAALGEHLKVGVNLAAFRSAEVFLSSLPPIEPPTEPGLGGLLSPLIRGNLDSDNFQSIIEKDDRTPSDAPPQLSDKK